jgi:hypothetical protein
LYETEILNGLIAGLIATGAMFLSELPAFLKWGTHGVMEKQINTIIVSRIIRQQPESLQNQGLPLHFIAGGLVGAAFALSLSIIPGNPPLVFLGVILGMILQLIGLLAFQTLTKNQTKSETIGYTPVLVSIIGHIIYGLVLGLTLEFM